MAGAALPLVTALQHRLQGLSIGWSGPERTTVRSKTAERKHTVHVVHLAIDNHDHGGKRYCMQMSHLHAMRNMASYQHLEEEQ